MEGLRRNKMKKMLCSLLTVLLLVSCFAGTVNAAERAMGKFDVTVKAGELKPAKTGFPMAAGETVTPRWIKPPLDIQDRLQQGARFSVRPNRLYG